jgi:hypothetical protein
MIERKPIIPTRRRTITGSFAFIEHRFLRSGFWNILNHHELILYLFLVLVADRNGLSFYSYDKICTLTKLILEEYIQARDGLIDKDLIAFNGSLFQVLSLPEKPVPGQRFLPPGEDKASSEFVALRNILHPERWTA